MPVNVHPQAIDLVDMQSELASPPNMQSFGPKVGTSPLGAPTAVGSGRLPVSATLLVCLPAIIPTLWMGGMVLLALAVRY